ncbi:GTPase IMAP family member 8-like [Thalassophryne amazonica]|uniref:GTPase IMAP family member 8-like n=1 Tax=Thalassophryne amazonica TaxID=390379 RepID=UPI0014720189|nr:GTPase IMAP family member 8-like [Thalassophryne amazonica]
MSNNSTTSMRQAMVVIATGEEWSLLKPLLQDNFGDEYHQLTFRSDGPTQVCDITVDGVSTSLYFTDLKQNMTAQDISQALYGCYKLCSSGNITFLLLIQGGHYTKSQRRMIEILQVDFGADVLKYLIVLSLDDGHIVDTLDDTLLELINTCDGRYCHITSSSTKEKLLALIEMANYVLKENGSSGYTENMLSNAKKRNMEDSAMRMLKEKLQEAEQKEQAFIQETRLQEERRAREVKELEKKHAEERKEEAAERTVYVTKRENLEEAVRSHRASLQLLIHRVEDETSEMSVVLLGLSGSGKSSAGNLILQRAASQYSISDPFQDPIQPTIACERKELIAAGKKLIVVDTPELWDEDGVEDLELVKDCLALALPGPHVFLLVLQVGRFTQGESEMLGHLQKIFGREFAEHAIVLFVHFDSNQHRPQKINDYVTSAHLSLQDLLRKCGSRYYELNVAKSHNALSYPQVKELLSGVNKLVASHGGSCFSSRRFSVQELKERKKTLEERKEEATEGNYLLRDS